MAWNKIYMNNKKQLKEASAAATTTVYCPGSAVHWGKFIHNYNRFP